VKPEIHLYYGMKNTDPPTYYGNLWSKESGKDKYKVSEFELVSFSQMMSRLAKRLRETDVADVYLHRFETESPLLLDPATVNLLRTDPAAAIRSMAPPGRVVHVRDKATVADEVSIKLRAGHDTLADAFGDWVYCKRREGKVEDPFTGRWSELCRSELHRPLEQKYVTVYQGDVDRLRTIDPEHTGRLEFPWYEADDANWARAKTADLIAFGALAGAHDKRGLFLPRRWNKSGPWITYGELEQMYRTYCREKEDAQ
jgi:hypothetical protein